jgi:acetyl-CoA synthetase
MISALASVTDHRPTYATAPLPGIFVELLDAKGEVIENSMAQGHLCISRPWPSLARTIYADHQRYLETYLTAHPGKYFTGDAASRDDFLNYRITGRVDDVINISGHRLGTAEVEDALALHVDVQQVAVVAKDHPIKGQSLFVYVVSNSSKTTKDLSDELKEQVSLSIGPIARPDEIICVSDLPKTRSGKIMRRILRKLAQGQRKNLGDLSTIVNPEAIDSIAATMERH